MIENDISKGNSFLFSNVLCITNNHYIVDQQFSKFVKFIEAQSDLIKKELQLFIGPLLCHLYLELLKGHEVKAAGEFLKKNANLIAPVESYEAPLPNKVNGCGITDTAVQDESILPVISINPQIRFAQSALRKDDANQEFFVNLIQILSTCLQIEAAECCEDVILFRSSKYEVEISENAMNVFNTFLQMQGHVLILKLIYTWIHITIKDIQDAEWSEQFLLFGNENDENWDSDENYNSDDMDSVEQVNGENEESLPPSNMLDVSAKSEDQAVSEEAQPKELCLEQTDNKTKTRSKFMLNVCLAGLKHSHSQLLKLPANPRFVRLLDPEKWYI